MKLPSIVNATSIKNISYGGRSLWMGVSSIGNITNLHELNLTGCSSLRKIPSSIRNLTYLHTLDLSGCQPSLGKRVERRKEEVSPPIVETALVPKSGGALSFMNFLNKLWRSKVYSKLEAPQRKGVMESLHY